MSIKEENAERKKIPHIFVPGEYLECDWCGGNKEDKQHGDY